MLRFLTAGESHGPSLTAILEGMPAGVPLTSAFIDRDLARRQHGYGSGGRMKIERDHAQLTGGVVAGKTTGGPISFIVENLDYAKWRDRDIEAMTIPRPGHADLTGAVKYGYRELRLALERASARETTMRVAVGSACRALLVQFGIVVGGYVVSVGDVKVESEVSSVEGYSSSLSRAIHKGRSKRCAMLRRGDQRKDARQHSRDHGCERYTRWRD